MGLTNRIYEAVLGDGTPDVQSRDRDDGYGSYIDDSEIDTISPPDDDLEHYWEQYEQSPIVRIPIRLYAEDITEPGYRIECKNDELAQKIESWLTESAIIAGESDHDFSELLHADIVQKEVRGTALVELVPKAESENELWGFRLINASTVSAYTYENQSVLMHPSDTEHPDVNLTDDGRAAAYGQWDDEALAGPFAGRDPIYLAQNDVIKRVQDADTSDIFGTSTIEPVSNEIDELRKLLASTSEAVKSKGFPHWVFKLGEPNGDVSDPRAGLWPDDKMKAYRDSHKKGNWSVGQKDFVPGDVEIDTISSDVPDIEELLNWYVEQIISAMPVPKYKIGHADSVNRDITKTQQAQYERKVQNERRRLERDYTPVLKRKAREWGYTGGDIESLELKIEEPESDNPLEKDTFDAGEFKEFAQGVKALAPGGQADLVVEPDEVRGMLGLDADGDDVPDLDDDEETAENIQAQFEELYDEPLVHDDEADVADTDAVEDDE